MNRTRHVQGRRRNHRIAVAALALAAGGAVIAAPIASAHGKDPLPRPSVPDRQPNRPGPSVPDRQPLGHGGGGLDVPQKQPAPAGGAVDRTPQKRSQQAAPLKHAQDATRKQSQSSNQKRGQFSTVKRAQDSTLKRSQGSTQNKVARTGATSWSGSPAKGAMTWSVTSSTVRSAQRG